MYGTEYEFFPQKEVETNERKIFFCELLTISRVEQNRVHQLSEKIKIYHYTCMYNCILPNYHTAYWIKILIWLVGNFSQNTGLQSG